MRRSWETKNLLASYEETAASAPVAVELTTEEQAALQAAPAEKRHGALVKQTPEDGSERYDRELFLLVGVFSPESEELRDGHGTVTHLVQHPKDAVGRKVVVEANELELNFLSSFTFQFSLDDLPLEDTWVKPVVLASFDHLFEREGVVDDDRINVYLCITHNTQTPLVLLVVAPEVQIYIPQATTKRKGD